jgi:S1-C subfamily serine protease
MIAISENQAEQARIAKIKHRKIAIATAIPVAFLPLLIWALFYFGAIPNNPSFASDIQEPVAKVVTKSGTGTAFLINSTTLLTARHVVDGMAVGDEVELFFEHSANQLQVKAKIRYIAPTDKQIVQGQVETEYFLTDMAVLEVSEISDIEPLVLGESSTVKNLDEVILIGYPNGDYSITKGNINSQRYHDVDLFKLDATSNPGNSGGPCILKNDNTVIGILVGGSTIAKQGENIALKIDGVKNILDRAGISY